MLSLLCCPLFGAAIAGDNKNNNGFTIDEAVAEIRAQTGGRILSAKTTHDKGKLIYQIRILNKNGRVQRFQLKSNQKGKQPSHNRQHYCLLKMSQLSGHNSKPS